MLKNTKNAFILSFILVASVVLSSFACVVQGASADGTWSVDENQNATEKETVNWKDNAHVSKFSDVNPGDWYYDVVMEMTRRGFFTGKGDIVNGVGTFAPNDIMKRAEFNAVLARILFGDKSLEQVEGEPWWYKSDEFLRAYRIIGVYDFTDSVEVPMTRAEMAYMAWNTLKYGEIWGYAFSKNMINYNNLDAAKDKIPDYKEIKQYSDAVINCYAQGIICGVDEKGTFHPGGYLTRAEAATVLYRLSTPESRTPVNFEVKFDEIGVSDPDAPITIYEGRLRADRFAKEGDTVIKEDGTQVVLKTGPHGILGEGQGVAADLGFQLDVNDSSTIVRAGNGGALFWGETDYIDGSGNGIIRAQYMVNYVTGEAHWYNEWLVMTWEPQTRGTFDFQLSADRNYVWMADYEEWTPVYYHNMSEEAVKLIKDANGIK